MRSRANESRKIENCLVEMTGGGATLWIHLDLSAVFDALGMLCFWTTYLGWDWEAVGGRLTLIFCSPLWSCQLLTAIEKSVCTSSEVPSSVLLFHVLAELNHGIKNMF